MWQKHSWTRTSVPFQVLSQLLNLAKKSHCVGRVREKRRSQVTDKWWCEVFSYSYISWAGIKEKRIFLPEISMCNDCLFARITSWASKPPQELIENNSHLRDHRKLQDSSLNHPGLSPNILNLVSFFFFFSSHHSIPFALSRYTPPPKKNTHLMWAKLGTKLGSERSYLILQCLPAFFSLEICSSSP